MADCPHHLPKWQAKVLILDGRYFLYEEALDKDKIYDTVDRDSDYASWSSVYWCKRLPKG